MKLKQGFIFPLIIILVGLAAYSNSFSGVFVFDDIPDIVENKRIQTLWPQEGIRGLSSRPLIDLTFSLNYAFHGLDIWGYHAFNLVVHLFSALILFGIVRRTLMTDRLKRRYGDSSSLLALAVALLWIVHPLQTQSVTYIIQRAESLMGFFYLLTLYGVIRGATVIRGRWNWYFLAIISCVLGMASKAVMFSAPIIILIYDRIFLTKSLREILFHRWGLYFSLFLSWALLYIFLAFNLHGDPETTAGFAYRSITPLQYLFTQPGVLLHYLKLSVWPSPLCIDYLWPVTQSISSALIPTFTIGSLLLFSFLALRTRPALGFVGFWFFLILAPTSSIMPIADAAFEHRMYLPLISVILLTVIGGYELVNRFGENIKNKAGVCLLIGAICLFGVLTFQRNRVYASEIALWTDTVGKRPENFRAFTALGSAFYKEGKLDRAVFHYLRALELKPHWPKAQHNLGLTLMDQGKFNEAIRHFEEVLRRKPDYERAHNNLGIALAKLGKLTEATEHFEAALLLQPQDADIHNNLANALAYQGKFDEAIRHYQTALQLKPDYPEAKKNLEKIQNVRQ